MTGVYTARMGMRAHIRSYSSAVLMGSFGCAALCTLRLRFAAAPPPFRFPRPRSPSSMHAACERPTHSSTTQYSNGPDLHRSYAHVCIHALMLQCGVQTILEDCVVHAALAFRSSASLRFRSMRGAVRASAIPPVLPRCPFALSIFQGAIADKCFIPGYPPSAVSLLGLAARLPLYRLHVFVFRARGVPSACMAYITRRTLPFSFRLYGYNPAHRRTVSLSITSRHIGDACTAHVGWLGVKTC
ncbi:hypothetical protein HYPSUDRAFT_784092 [Hypholoma sublateritium FD-334 SS-4]|uniref:Uncharacterized protein n=1 Tax=Hypholoma sublateritium (strain FD-334 SS-4) TaxID=945553 RepID=A0A0D2MBA8_HYPSF|nr:hypothetical protein HYPSUDRAFT_784092 [Hypholoma sublateritium FD-334 SS-4]